MGDVKKAELKKFELYKSKKRISSPTIKTAEVNLFSYTKHRDFC